jgi:hypothetical protein
VLCDKKERIERMGFRLPGVKRGREAVRDSDWMLESIASFQELLSKAEQEFGLGTIIQCWREQRRKYLHVYCGFFNKYSSVEKPSLLFVWSDPGIHR